MMPGAQMSRPKTMIIPGGKLSFAMETILAPLVQGLMEGKRLGATG
jgi:phosphoribulokinase